MSAAARIRAPPLLGYNGNEGRKLPKRRGEWLPLLSAHPYYDVLVRTWDLLAFMLLVVNLRAASLTHAVIAGFESAEQQLGMIIRTWITVPFTMEYGGEEIDLHMNMSVYNHALLSHARADLQRAMDGGPTLDDTGSSFIEALNRSIKTMAEEHSCRGGAGIDLVKQILEQLYIRQLPTVRELFWEPGCYNCGRCQEPKLGHLCAAKAQAQQIASLVDVVSLLVSRVPGAPMQMPHAEPARARAGHAAHSAAPRAAPAAEAAQPARPAAAAAPVASAGGGPATERPASGATRAASARGPSRRGGLPARVGDTSLRRSFVLSIPVARGANWFLAGGGRRMDEEEATAAAAERIAAAAEDGTSLPVRLATDVVRFLYGGTGRREPADGGVVSASLLNAKPAVGGIGVEPRGGGVLRVLFTVASDAVADTVVRWRHELRRCVDSTAVFDVLSDCEEAQHQALWPAFLAAKVAGKRAQFHRARLVVDGERVPAPAC
ncbi:hypothetical protein FOA52_004845 [Chlamydomonas sp. UWO 241]|nr:hypothetical protein FOA52_004845 [Chlamydomonas sp. UWO 241]